MLTKLVQYVINGMIPVKNTPIHGNVFDLGPKMAF
jgi:hypothetical protein